MQDTIKISQRIEADASHLFSDLLPYDPRHLIPVNLHYRVPDLDSVKRKGRIGSRGHNESYGLVPAG